MKYGGRRGVAFLVVSALIALARDHDVFADELPYQDPEEALVDFPLHLANEYDGLADETDGEKAEARLFSGALEARLLGGITVSGFVETFVETGLVGEFVLAPVQGVVLFLYDADNPSRLTYLTAETDGAGAYTLIIPRSALKGRPRLGAEHPSYDFADVDLAGTSEDLAINFVLRVSQPFSE